MRNFVLVVVLLAGVLGAGCKSPFVSDQNCNANECNGDDGLCVGCSQGATCSTKPAGNCSKPNDGVYCCVPGGSGSGSGGAGGNGGCPSGKTPCGGGCMPEGSSCCPDGQHNCPTPFVCDANNACVSGGGGSSSSGGGSSGSGCTAQVCCGGLYECNGACYATCVVGSQPCCTATECVCYTPCC